MQWAGESIREGRFEFPGPSFAMPRAGISGTECTDSRRTETGINEMVLDVLKEKARENQSSSMSYIFGQQLKKTVHNRSKQKRCSAAPQEAHCLRESPSCRNPLARLECTAKHETGLGRVCWCSATSRSRDADSHSFCHS